MKGDSNISLTILGAAESVGQSEALIDTLQSRLVLDKGAGYEGGTDSLNPDKTLYDPKSADALILSHAHADHVGRVMHFVKAGFDKSIYSTYETADISHVQFQQIASGPYLNKNLNHRFSRDENALKYADMKTTMALFASDNGAQGFAYKNKISITPDVDITFFDAGHIPGSAQTLFEIKKDGKKIKLLSTGDLGRTDYKILGHPIADIPIVRFPETNLPKDIDYLIVEATYGNKTHAPLEDSIKVLETAVKDAYDNKGKIVIPAFSIMRTHMVWNFLFDLYNQKRLPKDMIMYSSSPTADKLNRIILRHTENLDDAARKQFADFNNNPFYFQQLVHHKKMDETLVQLSRPGPSGFIGASGMCQFGRVVPMLYQTIDDPKNIILLVGYQSPGTRGSSIQNKDKFIQFDAGSKPLLADVRKMSGTSGHADYIENIAHATNMRNPKKGEQFKKIFIQHGDKDACHQLRQKFIEAGYNPETVTVALKGQKYVLD